MLIIVDINTCSIAFTFSVDVGSNSGKKRKRSTDKNDPNLNKKTKNDKPHVFQQQQPTHERSSMHTQGGSNMSHLHTGQTFSTFPSISVPSTPGTDLVNVSSLPNNRVVLFNISGQIVPVILPVLNMLTGTQPNGQLAVSTKAQGTINTLSVPHSELPFGSIQSSGQCNTHLDLQTNQTGSVNSLTEKNSKTLPAVNTRPFMQGSEQVFTQAKIPEVICSSATQDSKSCSVVESKSRGRGKQKSYVKSENFGNFTDNQLTYECVEKTKNEAGSEFPVVKQRGRGGRARVRGRGTGRGGCTKRTTTKKPAVPSKAPLTSISNMEASCSAAESRGNMTRQRPPLGRVLKAAYANIFKRRIEKEKEKEKQENSALLPDPFKMPHKTENKLNGQMNTPSISPSNRSSTENSRTSNSINNYSFTDEDNRKFSASSTAQMHLTLPGGSNTVSKTDSKSKKSTNLPFEMLKVTFCSPRQTIDSSGKMRTDKPLLICKTETFHEQSKSGQTNQNGLHSADTLVSDGRNISKLSNKNINSKSSVAERNASENVTGKESIESRQTGSKSNCEILETISKVSKDRKDCRTDECLVKSDTSESKPVTSDNDEISQFHECSQETGWNGDSQSDSCNPASPSLPYEKPVKRHDAVAIKNVCNPESPRMPSEGLAKHDDSVEPNSVCSPTSPCIQYNKSIKSPILFDTKHSAEETFSVSDTAGNPEEYNKANCVPKVSNTPLKYTTSTASEKRIHLSGKSDGRDKKQFDKETLANGNLQKVTKNEQSKNEQVYCLHIHVLNPFPMLSKHKSRAGCFHCK